MSYKKQTTRLPPAAQEALLTLLETLPDAFFVVDDDTTILYTNASAHTLIGASPEQVRGNTFWRSAPQLVSAALYQAMLAARETGALTEVEYVSPVTRRWLHVQISPAIGRLILQFQEKKASLPRQETAFPDERLVADVLESLSVGIAVLTPRGIVLEINEALLADAQVQREQVIGHPFAQTLWWSSVSDSQEQLLTAISRASRGETVRFETVVHPRAGIELHFEATITPHRDVDQHIYSLVYVGTDITASKRVEAEVSALLDAIPQLIWMARPDGAITYYNQRAVNYLAMTHLQTEGTGWLVEVHPDDQPRAWQEWQTSLQTEEPYEMELRLRDNARGVYRWFLVRGMPVRSADGTVLKWVGTCTDIEDRKQAEERIKASQEHLHMLAETVPQLVWMTRAEDSMSEYFNQRFCDYTCATQEQLYGYGWSQFLHPEDYARTIAARTHAYSLGTPYEVEYRLREGKTGVYRWFLARALPVRDEEGHITRWFGTCTDIEEQKRTEEALRQSQERVCALMNSSIIGINIAEGEQIVDANDTFLRMTGYTRQDLQEGRINWMQMTPPEDLARTLQAHQELAAAQLMTPYEKEYICKDGSRLPVLVGRIALQADPPQAIGFVLDNSARKELERRKDAFISMASHELRNPLAALKLQISMLHKQLARQGIQVSALALSRIQTQTDTLTRLVEELLDVSKIQAGRLEYVREPVELDELLQEIAETIQQTHPSHRVLVRGRLHSSLLGDRDRLSQVFINLLSNAIKYSPDAGTVELDLSATEDAVTIRVHDHGLGIPQEQYNKIFERFYRVSDPKHKVIPGLGMGLYIVAEIVKGHRGTISVDSIVGKGSTFTVTLPRTRDAWEEKSPPLVISHR